MAKLPLLEIISAGGLCTGCGLCESVTGGKAKMAFNQHGFLRPIVMQPLTPQDDSLVRAVCPGLGLSHPRETASYHPLWGPVMAVHTGYALDPALRHAGSSGGAISALLCYLLESKKVDYVLHIGASLSEPLINEVKLSRSRSEVLANAGSRYAPSAPLTGIDLLLARPGRMVFVGKPCDVAALRKYAQQNPQVNEKVPYMLSFMCAGVPSMKGTEAILTRFDVKPTEVRSFAYRGNGWPGMTRVETHTGVVHETDYATSWGTVLNRHLQARCKICPDGIGEFADVVCADAWYGKDGYPDFAEQEGRSLVISRTDQGQQLLAEATAAGYLSVAPLEIEEVRKMQPYQENRKQMVLARVLALRLMGRPAPVFHRLRLQRTALMGGLKANAKNFLGMVKRLAFKRQLPGM